MIISKPWSNWNSPPRDYDKAQSEVLGTILLAGLVVLMGAVFAPTFFSWVDTGESLHSEINVEVINESVTVLHNGGDSIETQNLEMTVTFEGTQHRYAADADGSIGAVFGPGMDWNVSEGLPFGTDDIDKSVRVYVIDTKSNTVLFGSDLTIQNDLDTPSSTDTPTETSTPTATPSPTPTPEPDPFFEIVEVDHPGEVTEGDTVTFNITINNTGDGPGEQIIRIDSISSQHNNGDTFEDVDQKSVSLDAGKASLVTLQWTAEYTKPGGGQGQGSEVFDITISSENDSWEGEIEVAQN